MDTEVDTTGVEENSLGYERIEGKRRPRSWFGEGINEFVMDRGGFIVGEMEFN